MALEWGLVRPIDLSLDRESDGSYIVSDDIFNIAGEGVTAVDAVRDYYASLIEYYQLLSAHDDEPTKALHSSLRRYLQVIPK
jgi:hypothetical protein